MVQTTYDPGGLIAGDFPVKHRSVTIINSVALIAGAVLGRITASDKYILSATAAADGSEVPVAVLAADVDASGGDAAGPVYFTGEFATDKMSFGTGHDEDTVASSWRQTSKSLFAIKRV